MKPCCSVKSSSEITSRNPFKTLAEYLLVCFGRNLTTQLTFIFLGQLFQLVLSHVYGYFVLIFKIRILVTLAIK